jgi:hypothetical protein
VLKTLFLNLGQKGAEKHAYFEMLIKWRWIRFYCTNLSIDCNLNLKLEFVIISVVSLLLRATVVIMTSFIFISLLLYPVSFCFNALICIC